MPYEGVWYWNVFFYGGDDEPFEGLLSISDAYSRNGEVGGEGPWVWCVTEECDEDWDGHGEIYEDTEDSNRLKTAFIESDGGLKLLAYNYNNQIGNEVDGEPTFIGDGSWIYYGGDSTDIW